MLNWLFVCVQTRWSKSDPIENGWRVGTSVKFYKFSTTVEDSDRTVSTDQRMVLVHASKIMVALTDSNC